MDAVGYSSLKLKEIWFGERQETLSLYDQVSLQSSHKNSAASRGAGVVCYGLISPYLTLNTLPAGAEYIRFFT